MWVLFGLGATVHFGLGRFGECSRDILGEIPSSGDLIAVVFRTSCNATVPLITSVAVRNSTARHDVKDLDAFFRLRGVHANLDVRWTQDHPAPSLTIAYPKDAPVLLKAVVWNGLNVSYAAR